jgi:hypothetical protein
MEKTAEIHNVSKHTIQKYGDSKLEQKNPEFVQVDNPSLFENETEGKVAYTHLYGHIAEQKVVTESLKRGYIVSEPIVESRYDLLIDNGEEIKRIQVKYTSDENNGSYAISLQSQCRHNGYRRKYTQKEVDAVIAYIGEEDSFVLIPPKVFENQKTIKIRFDETKNNQEKFVHFYEDYKW